MRRLAALLLPAALWSAALPAAAGPLGPGASDAIAALGARAAREAREATADTGLRVADCDDSYPFDLAQVPGNTDVLRRFDPARSWGTVPMVDLLLHATGTIAARYPHADPVLIGDLSRARGGALPPHRWHHDGRSADVGLFRHGGRQPRVGFERVWPSQLDVERTWALIEAMLATGYVEHILLDEGLIRRLKAYVREEGLLTPEQIRATFPAKGTPKMWRMRGILRHAPHHGDHMHVRVACEPG